MRISPNNLGRGTSIYKKKAKGVTSKARQGSYPEVYISPRKGH